MPDDAGFACLHAKHDVSPRLESNATKSIAPAVLAARPKVAVLREQGVNSHVEMAYAFTEAGFEALTCIMTDPQTAAPG